MITLPKKHSFFLFGPRQTGKSTLLKSVFGPEETLYYDLLRSEEYRRFTREPSLFREEVRARDNRKTHVIVDEIQRVPELLNEIHSLIEGERPPFFGLSGSSARKLKRAHANLLAGRAWNYQIFPLTHQELGNLFSLEKALNIGTLPSVYLNSTREEARKTLTTYVETYLKEEIEQEALVRNLGGFLRFLPMAGDENGRIINYSNISREIGVSYNTVKEYFKILEDTLIGFMLWPYAKSARKRLTKHPKFYFFDVGVQRAMTRKISIDLEKKTSDYGRVFEHFMIAEIMRLSFYKERDYRFSFYQSAHHAEVDLIVETPKGKTFAIEIKATEVPDLAVLKGLRSFSEICPKADFYCVSLAPRARKTGGISILPWQDIFEVLELNERGA